MHDDITAIEERAERVRRVLSYHRRTMHHLHRYAQSAGYLDWATQPAPFRTFDGAPLLPLPLLADALNTSFDDLYRPGAVAPRPVDVNSLAVLLELALGLSAWKEYNGSRWALRCNPSSGNLHPTEGYVIVPALPGMEAGVYHYVSRDHTLERRRGLDADTLDTWPPGTFLVGLSSIHWREAWKYGERAFRYCQHDVGHALAAVRFAAAALGWSARLLDHLGDDTVSAWLGLDSAGFAALDPLDREHPDALLLVGPPALVSNFSQSLRAHDVTSRDREGAGQPRSLTVAARQVPRSAAGLDLWLGSANPLSPNHVHWEVIDNVAAASWRPATNRQSDPDPAPLPEPLPTAAPAAATLIRQRRSCLALDGRSPLEAARFYHILDRLLPRPEVPPWDLLPWTPHVHAAIFVLRVQGLQPGLYLFERCVTAHDDLRTACRPEFVWQKPPGCPDHLALYLLDEGDYRERARTVSCHQDIAADGAFSLGMIAAFGDTIRATGAWWYRRLFWEAGVLGQVLYLEAEAAGVRGTGIGCYFDDVMHEILGLQGDRWQSLYHFTVGTPVEDTRLRTLTPYAHLQR